MKDARHALLQAAIERCAKEIRESADEDELPTADFDEWSDAIFSQVIEDPEIMMPIIREVFERVTGIEVDDE